MASVILSEACRAKYSFSASLNKRLRDLLVLRASWSAPLQNIVRYRQCGFHTVGPEGDQNKLVCTRVGEPKCPNWAGTQGVARAYYERGRAWPCFAIAAGLRSSLVRNFVPRAGNRWLPVLSLQQLQR